MVGRYYAINVSTFQSNFTGDAVAIRKARRLANDCRKDSMRNGHNLFHTIAVAIRKPAGAGNGYRENGYF